jgi:hypothetical protein
MQLDGITVKENNEGDILSYIMLIKLIKSHNTKCQSLRGDAALDI